MRTIILVIVLSLVSTFTCFAKEPSDTLSKYIDKTIQVFKTYDNSNNSTEYKLQFEEKLVDLAKEIFSFHIMARMVLGRNYREFSNEQQKEFECLFIDLLTQNYFDKILAHVEDIKKISKK